MFLGKYKNKKRLGKGAYGDVYLVEDQQEQQFALKLISVQMMEQQPHLRQYLDGEIQCMRSMNSPYITKLYDVQEDATNIYLLLEYCDGGDLINCQSRLKEKVFSLEKASAILSEVIIGLEQLHLEGYLHRDIKPQNVLIKTENGKEVYKLADFGFTKKSSDIGGTVLGTEQFMSPQIFAGNQDNFYGFEVDMWAFGVLFYFMLNMEFPFKLNPHWTPEKKEVELKKQAAKFSYKQSVQKSKKKIQANCTPEVEDLFKRMFDADGKSRITFSEIRTHSIFIKHFPFVPQASKILYGKKFQSKIIKKQLTKSQFKAIQENQQENIRSTMSVMRKKDKQFPQQKQILERKKDELDFLKLNAEQFLDVGDVLKNYEKYMLSFNLLKYYLVLLKDFQENLNAKSLSERYPNLKWQQFLTTKEFKLINKETQEDLNKGQMRFQDIYDLCDDFLKEISEINPKFANAFKRQITETGFQGPFKQSYRKSTITIFGVLRETLKTKGNKKGNKLNYILSILVISHAFNNIFSDYEHLGVIFAPYLSEKKKAAEKIDYSELREWMSKSQKTVLNDIAKNIIKIYFAS